VQQGVENFFATQRILVDLAMTQNTNAVNLVRKRFADPEFCPVGIVSELAAEAMSNFIEGQKLLLNLIEKEHEIVTEGVKQRVSGSNAAVAATELFQRGFASFVEMQQDFLKTAHKQTETWLHAIRTGKTFDPEGLVEAAREAMEAFVHTQKKFLDVIADEAVKATSGKVPVQRTKKTELSELATEASEAFIEAQKKLMDVAGRQVNAGVKAAERAVSLVAPFPFIPIPDLTREGVKNFVSAEKALIDTVMHRPETKHTTKTTARRKRPGRNIKVETAHAATA
jgi:hypothetical protein